MLKIPKAVVIQLVVTSLIAIALGIFVDSTSFYHIRSFDRAFFRQLHDPTSANEAALRAEQEKLHHLRTVFTCKAALLFFCLSNLLYSLLRRKFWLAYCSFVAACTTLLISVGIPSLPIDRSYAPVWIGDLVLSQGMLQLYVLCVWLASLLLLIIALTRRYRTKPNLSE